MIIVNKLSEIGISNKSRVLFTMPHPDDEAVFTSGLIQRLISSRIQVKLIVFTRGEASTLRYGLMHHEDLAKVRFNEQRRAAKILGVRKLEIKSLKDGGIKMHEREVVKILHDQINKFNPTTLVTLEPDGIYGHPDHIALSLFSRKFALDNNIDLIYATVRPNFILPSASHMAEKDVIEPIKPEYLLHLTPREIITKIRALSSHTSQLQFSLLNLRPYIFFLRNKILWSEYYSNPS